MSSETSAPETPTTDMAWDRLTKRLHVGQLIHGQVEETQMYGVFFDVGFQFPAFMDVIDARHHSYQVGEDVCLKIVQLADHNRQIRVASPSEEEAALARLGQLDLGAAAQIEGEYLKLKKVYDRLDADERNVLRNALIRIVEATNELTTAGLSNFRIPLESIEEFYDQTGDVVHSEYGNFKPSIALQAINAWDQGREFTPSSLFQLLTARVPSKTSDTAEKPQ
ncbi:MAG: hypothetical protein R3C02_16595 [Planctomycetaceae bacterium]